MITIATIPKPFLGESGIIQRNAIKSWIKLLPKCEIILFGDDEGIEETAKEFDLVHIPNIKKEFGVPLFSSVIELTRKKAKNQYIAYVNADNILMDNFLGALEKVNFPLFLMSGRRCDLEIKEEINFDEKEWEENLFKKIKEKGILHGWAGMDYFIFPKILDFDLPPFVAGRPGYDSWMVYNARYLNIPVIDATNFITVIHQNHKPVYSSKGLGAKKNSMLGGGTMNMFTLRDADWILTSQGVKKPAFPRMFFPALSFFYPWRLLLAFKRKFKG